MGKPQPTHQTKLNTRLKYLPEDLISYIVYHETAHNIERKHNDNFWAYVSKRFPNHNDMEEDLLALDWFLVLKNKNIRPRNWVNIQEIC